MTCFTIHVNYIFSDESLKDCKMNDQSGKAGLDADWIATINNTTFDKCKQYCQQFEFCVAIHYENDNSYCFIYNKTSTLINKTTSIYSQKHCVDTQSR